MNFAIIPARGGSKGIPGKNIRLVGGKPLLAWSIQHALRTPQISRIFVSTDSNEIAAVARDYGAEVIERPPDISGDTASSESCLVHALDYLENVPDLQVSGLSPHPSPPEPHVSGLRPQPSVLDPHVSGLRFQPSTFRPPDLVVFLQPTSPLREADDIQKAIQTLERENADSLFSACGVEGFVWRVEKDGTLRSFTYDHLNRPRRQDAPEDLIENGSIYIFKPWVLRQFNNRLGGKIAVYRMPALNSFQIDEPADLELIEHLMAYRNAEQKAESGKQKVEIGELKSVVSSPVVSGLQSAVNSQLSRIKLLVLDFDGVMTDNRVMVTEEGKEAVFCNRGDGLGLQMLRGKGIEVVVISKEKNPVVAVRCRKLGIDCIQGCDDKLAALQQKAVSSQWSVVDGLKPEQIAYVGNDVNDLECLRWVGMPVAVSDALPEVLAVAKLRTTKPGGHGAVREVCDLLLKSMVSGP